MLFFLLGCFAPKFGEWAFYDVEASGDCALDSAQTLDRFISLEQSDSAFNIVDEASFPCSLEGSDFSCDEVTSEYEGDEVTVSVKSIATGSFESSVSGSLSWTHSWSCISGDCATYGLTECTSQEEGQLSLSE